jgi:hypothetical protein
MSDVVVLGEPKTIKIKSIAARTQVSFLAILTSFSDSFDSNWDSDVVYGRQDAVKTFKNTERKLSFGVNIVAGSVEDAVENYRKIALLQRMLYPKYKELEAQKGTKDRIISTVPMLGFYFYPLIAEYNERTKGYDYLYGTVDGVAMNPNIEQGFLFTDRGVPYPREYSLEISFSVTHKNDLGWYDSGGRSLETKRLSNGYRIKKHFKG